MVEAEKIAALFDPKKLPGGMADLPEGLTDLPKMTIGRYTDMEGLLSATEQPRTKSGGWRGCMRGAHGARWYGLPDGTDDSLPNVARIVRTGWEDGARRLSEKLSQLSALPTPRSIRRRRVRADQGDSIDIHAVYAGRLDSAWERCARRESQGRLYVRIVVDAIEFGGANAERMFWRGAACVALADILQAAGYAVELISAWKGRALRGRSGEEISVCCTIKQFSAPLDLPTAAAGMALPAFFRCIGHAWGNAHAPTPYEYAGGFGVNQLAPQDFPGAIIAFQHDANNEKAAHEWIAEQVRRMNSGELQMITA